ncbi:MAG: polynucleotide adenylyltransferase PcnB [Chlamydiales bacterium]
MEPKIYQVKDHQINPKWIDPDAIFIVEHLRQNGYESYLVGGSVRDLLLGRRPKDFDISTSALPEQIKDVFGRRCIIIGRRFRMAHIRIGKKIFEVSTFRAGDTESSELILCDNVWGTPEEDVMRRDFTINGLFYDPHEHTVIDYSGGWEDIQRRLLRTIGVASSRFLQDPVRMIRLLKFQARLDFNVDKEAAEALETCKESILQSAPARVLEELLRMLESGSAREFFELLESRGVLELIFPWMMHFLEIPKGKIVYEYLRHADQVNQSMQRGPMDRCVLASCLIYPIFEGEVEKQYTSKGIVPHLGQVHELALSLMHGLATSSFTHFPRRLNTLISYVLTTQYRLTPLSNRRFNKMKLLRSSDFRFALAFLKLRSYVNPKLSDIYEQWRTLYYQHKEEYGKTT